MSPSRIIAAFAAIAVLAACGGEPETPTVLHRGNTDEPLTLDPHKAALLIEYQILSDLFESLYRIDASGEIEAALARDADVSEDGLVWTFSMHESRWSDGEPVTAHDFVAGMRRAVDPDTLYELASTYAPIENAQAIMRGEMPADSLGVTALDDLTLEIRLAYPVPYMPSFLASIVTPLPRHAYARLGDGWGQPGEMVSNGPYTLSRWRSRDFIELVANPNYREADALCFATVLYYPTVDRVAAQRRVRSGELDLVVDIDPASLAFLQENEPDMLHASSSVAVEDILFNTSEPPFDDVRVRQAVSMAIDRRFLADDVLGGSARPAWRMLAPDLPGAAPGLGFDYADERMDTRREEARRLLEEAGFGPDNPLELTFRHTPAFGRAGPVIQDNLAAIAPWVSVQLQQNDSQIHYAWMRAGDFQFGQNSWTPTIHDPEGVLFMWSSAAGDVNYSRWTDPDYDRIYAAALQSADPAERMRLMGEAEQMLLDNVPHTPLTVPQNFDLVSTEISGWTANARRVNPTRWLCREGLEPGAAMAVD